MKKPYYTPHELFVLANECSSYDQLERVSIHLKWLWALGEKINLELFRRFSHLKLNEIYSK